MRKKSTIKLSSILLFVIPIAILYELSTYWIDIIFLKLLIVFSFACVASFFIYKYTTKEAYEVFKNIPTFFFIVDKNANVIYVNSELLKFLGKDGYEDCKGWELMNYRDINECEVCKIVKQARVEGKIIKGIANINIKNKIVTFEVFASPYKDGAIVMLNDITKEKVILRELENSLKNIILELHSTNNSLVNSIKRSVENLESLYQHLYNVIYDLDDIEKSTEDTLDSAINTKTKILSLSNGINGYNKKLEEEKSIVEESYVKLKNSIEYIESTISYFDELKDAILNRFIVIKSSFEEIIKISNGLSNITENTKILSLNASIEAAASESGAGFRVIAQEIKNLAHSSQNLIDNILSKIEEVDNEISKGEKEIKHTLMKLKDNSNNTIDYLKSIENFINKVILSYSDLINNFSIINNDFENVKSQVDKIEEKCDIINKKVVEINDIVEISGDIMKDTKKSITEVYEIENKLSELIETLKKRYGEIKRLFT